MSHEEKINMVQPIHLSKNVDDMLDELNRKGETIFDFVGSAYVESLFYLYLLKKYKSECYVGKETKKRRLGLAIDIKDKYPKKEMEEMEEYLEDVASQVAECIVRGKTIIIIPLQIKVKEGYHANVLIYRKNNNQLEHFEPHGKYYEFKEEEKGNVEKTKVKLFNMFVKMINTELIRSRYKMPPIKYTKSNDVCPYIHGLQNLEGTSKLKKTNQEPNGYCVAWSMFFTELCLKNPEIPSSMLLDNVYDKLIKTSNAGDYLKKVIRGYAGIIYEKFTKMLSVFFKEKVTIDMIRDLFISKNNDDLIRANKSNIILFILIRLEIKKLDPEFDSKTEMKRLQNLIDDMMPKNYTRKDRKEKEKENRVFRDLVWKKKVLQNYDEFNQMISPLIDEDKMTIKPIVYHDKRKLENAIIRKLPIEYQWLKKDTPSPTKFKAKTIRKKSSPKAKTIRKTSHQQPLPPQPPVLDAPLCKAGEIINQKTGKCMRITTMIKQIIKKNKLTLAENNIDDFIDVAREKKLSLRSEEEITRALNILINSEILW